MQSYFLFLGLIIISGCKESKKVSIQQEVVMDSLILKAYPVSWNDLPEHLKDTLQIDSVFKDESYWIRTEEPNKFVRIEKERLALLEVTSKISDTLTMVAPFEGFVWSSHDFKYQDGNREMVSFSCFFGADKQKILPHQFEQVYFVYPPDAQADSLEHVFKFYNGQEVIERSSMLRLK